MAKLIWDELGKHFYETGISNGVLYLVDANGKYPEGVAWSGLTGVDENPSGAEESKLYADNTKYLSLYSAEEFGCTIKAYTYPDEFEECDGSAELAEGVIVGQQPRSGFGLVYKTVLGNDTQGESYGYKLHLVYGCKASPSAKSYATINDSPEANEFSWEVTTTPVAVPNHKNASTLTINSKKLDDAKLATLEEILFGVDAEAYDSSKTYNIGDYCTHQESGESTPTTYKCNSDEVTGEWNASKWTALTHAAGPRLPLPAEVISIVGE